MTITGKQKQTGLCYRAFKSDSAERADMKREIIFPDIYCSFRANCAKFMLISL